MAISQVWPNVPRLAMGGSRSRSWSYCGVERPADSLDVGIAEDDEDVLVAVLDEPFRERGRAELTPWPESKPEADNDCGGVEWRVRVRAREGRSEGYEGEWRGRATADAHALRKEGGGRLGRALVSLLGPEFDGMARGGGRGGGRRGSVDAAVWWVRSERERVSLKMDEYVDDGIEVERER